MTEHPPDYGDPRQERRVRRWLRTTTGMEHFLAECFGAGSWSYDAHEDVWVILDQCHTGQGRGFLIVRRGGDWFKSVLPARVLS